MKEEVEIIKEWGKYTIYDWYINIESNEDILPYRPDDSIFSKDAIILVTYNP